MIIKTLAELAEPDEASLAIRPIDIDPAAVAEGVAEYRQRLVADFELIDGVPESTRNSYDRVRTIYSYGVFCYDLYTVAGNQARLVLEQALRERFLPFYGGTVTFIDGKGGKHEVRARRFSDLFDRGIPLSGAAGGSSSAAGGSRFHSTGCWLPCSAGPVRSASWVVNVTGGRTSSV